MKQLTKIGKKRAWAISICAAVAAGLTVAAFFLFGAAKPQSVTVSAGLQYTADRAYLAASAPAGESVTFDAAWFDGALLGDKVTAVTVTELPDATDGELMLGHGEVAVGQRIDRDNFSYLTFTPLAGVTEAAFCFVPETARGAAGYALCCRLSVTDGVNCCPTVGGVVTAVSTYSTLALDGKLEADDPEGDALVFEVVAYPENGILTLDAKTGRYAYAPSGQFAGEDAFTWRVQDAHGAYGEESRVEIAVRTLATGYLFDDMENVSGRTHAAALRLTEKGLMSGEVVGGKHYFRPERTLTRAGFVSILMQAAGIECPEADDTGYTDDADIPRGMKGAIRYAREQGWLGEDTVFRPNDPVTRAEAASIAAKALGLSAPGYGNAVKDHADIPVSVVDALYSVFEGGYLSTVNDGALAPAAALTRGEAADFFARILDRKEAK